MTATPSNEPDSRQILVVDDEPLVLEGMRAMLARMGYGNIEITDRAKDALGRLDNGDCPELILLDLNMPEVDGMAFVRGLVDRKYRGHLILISGEDERILQTVQHLIRAHGIDVLGHLQKPVPKQALAALLEGWKPRPERRSRPGRTQYGADAVREAIDRDQLELHYQPKVSVHDGEFVGVEALVRWRHPVDGLIYPDQFIAVAEEHGLIDDLTRCVLRAAIRQGHAWRDQGLTLRIAVNVSMDNLSALDFADFAANLAKSEKVEPEFLTLEVTESRLAQDMRGPLETLTRLRIKRFGLAIDDFGTGHSSLAQLRDIPFDELKIDRSFVHGVAHNDTVRAIHAASVGMAKQLRMRIVAEGVEDAEDWAFLKTSGADYAQGYFIGRPMPAADIATWRDGWAARAPELGFPAS